MPVFMIIIACGAGLGTGCDIDTSWVASSICEQAQKEIRVPVNTSVTVTCVRGEKAE